MRVISNFLIVLAIILIILGITSYLQYKQGWNFAFLKFLSWVNNWGPDNANYIRIGAVVLALVLLIAGSRKRTHHYISRLR